MIFNIDFQSEEALYMQLRNQIITLIATEEIREGDILPSVRQLADNIGINMHTVNKAYAVLKDEGFITLDRRRGAVICLDYNKLRAVSELSEEIKMIIAKALCKGLTPDEIHRIIDDVIGEYGYKGE